MGTKQTRISDECVLVWAAGLPASAEETVIVSLLGEKADGLSEFSFYSFRGGFEKWQDRPNCPTFEEWLSAHCKPKQFRVYEYPTIDLRVPPDDMKCRAIATILSSLETGKTVVVVDSGGVGRTGNVLSAVSSRLGIKLIPQPVAMQRR